MVQLYRAGAFKEIGNERIVGSDINSRRDLSAALGYGGCSGLRLRRSRALARPCPPQILYQCCHSAPIVHEQRPETVTIIVTARWLLNRMASILNYRAQ